MQLEEALFGNGGQQVRLVGEVAVGRREADACTPCGLAQREALWPLLRYQGEGGLGERPLQIAMVVARLLRRRRHVDDFNIEVYVKAINIKPEDGK